MVAFWTVFAGSTVMLGCGCNVIFLEYIIRASGNSGNMIVFFQFLFVAVEGFINHKKFGRTPRIIPMKHYLLLTVLYFSVSVSNIMALGCDIPMPLHMIFKSGSLVANLIMGIVILKRSYGIVKYLAIMLVSLGIFACTVATGSSSTTSEDGKRSLFVMLVGVAFLTVALLLSARMGIFQEVLFSKYGKQSREAMFYNHAIPLPFFIILAPSILENIDILNKSEVFPVPLITDAYAMITGDRDAAEAMTSLPVLWQYMIGNLITQYICIRSVFYLTSVCPSLTVTLIITLRKFVSIVISVFYFKNEFTELHWLGASLVFAGTLLYSDIFSIFSKQSLKSATTHKNGVLNNGFHHNPKKEKVS